MQDFLFGVTSGEMEKRASLVESAGLPFPGINGRRTMTNEVAKKNVALQLQARKVIVCLWSISETLQCQKLHGIFTYSTVFERVCFDGQMEQSFRRFPTVSLRGRREGVRKRKKLRERQEE